MSPQSADYVTRVVHDPHAVPADAWDALLRAHPAGAASGPFMRHAYLAALHDSGCATPATGWSPHWVTLWTRGDGALAAAAPLYVKTHSFGEYVFDWAWAQAHHRHGVRYYPKGVVAVPFTPVAGPRLLARDADARAALVHALIAHARAQGLSSLHILLGRDADWAATDANPALVLLPRDTVQFHWHNRHPVRGTPFADWEDLLASLSQDKRKKIRQERRKVAAAGVTFEARRGADITAADWAFFTRCYTQTYVEHGNPPYLNEAFFRQVGQALPQQWLMFIARDAQGTRIAASLVALSDDGASPAAAYGRYWGALARVDCLHFEACYYQPLAWCVAHGVQRFEGGAQGEHKMARALLPTVVHSRHWLAHPAFADAVADYLARERAATSDYRTALQAHAPFRQAPSAPDCAR
ncbi:Peptidogalycan biosysnthesis/recognition [Tepidimonas thermarum]|uniref:Peptidogalycan biosysnthesis/recognition n=1 Tax=Tepidimonas thermarum TaxID=335431 RepID=A0A554X7L9_9BURK|nr:GNAT family N-acetyltransferase [Tepidimonas thermarum]TSE31821.1 Peptidogalycan biosysnthesis/recognition [Tepidimonas thermarum]